MPVAAQLERLQSLTAEALQLADATDDDLPAGRIVASPLGTHPPSGVLVADARHRGGVRWRENRFAARGAVGLDDERDLTGQGTRARRSAFAQRRPGSLRTDAARRGWPARSSSGSGCWPNRATPANSELADQIEQNYRNANVRLALSAEMLERFVRSSNTMSRARSTIASSARRSAASRSPSAENKVKLEPDAERWNMDLESDGTVDSRHRRRRRPGEGQQPGHDGLHGRRSRSSSSRTACRSARARPTPTTAASSIGVHSNYDWMPVVNDMVRTRAIDEYHRKQPLAQAEVECKVARRVEQQLDDRAGAAVNKVENQIRDQVTGTAGVGRRRADADRTLDDRRARDRPPARGRAASNFAAHTPRPRAPSDSLASVQVHESALDECGGQPRPRRQAAHCPGAANADAGKVLAYSTNRAPTVVDEKTPCLNLPRTMPSGSASPTRSSN